MRYDDLPLKVRRQVDAQLGRKPRQKVTRRAAPVGGATLRCRGCGAVVSAIEGALQRHQEAEHPGQACRYEALVSTP